MLALSRNFQGVSTTSSTLQCPFNLILRNDCCRNAVRNLKSGPQSAHRLMSLKIKAKPVVDDDSTERIDLLRGGSGGRRHSEILNERPRSSKYSSMARALHRIGVRP